MEKIDIEKSIIKKFRKEVWRKFTKAVTDYELINDGDKIAVCISGGKDSFLMAKCLEEIKKHGKIDFDLEFISMDPGYSEENVLKIKKNADILGLDVKIFKTEVFEIAKKLNEKSPCYMCARMRRGYLYDYARSLGCNKIALGHHFDDVVETILMNMFYNGKIETMLPKLRSTNFDGLELIRPLYLVKEEDILRWCKYNNLEFFGCACNLKEENSKRQEMKLLVKELLKTNEFVDKNIFKAMTNINLDQVIEYKDSKTTTNFLDKY